VGKLTDRLGALGHSAKPALGFGPASIAERSSAMLLVVEAPATGPVDRLRSATGVADVFVLSGLANPPMPPQPTLEAIGDGAWGITGAVAAPDDLDALKDAGCDLLLISGDDGPGAVLRDDGMARGYAISPGLSEERARAIEDLPFDFLVLEPDEESWPITLAGVMQLQSTVSLVSKHIILRVRQLPPEQDLALLRDMPISGLLVDLSAVAPETLAEARKTIDGLEPRKTKQAGEQTPALAVQPGMPTGGRADAGEEDWDDDYEDQHGRAATRH